VFLCSSFLYVGCNYCKDGAMDMDARIILSDSMYLLDVIMHNEVILTTHD
jgi:hypothetical protein